MIARPPMQVVSWRADFLEVLAGHLAEPARAEGLERLRVIFPHNRPARHLRAALAARPDLPRPLLLPRMQSLDEFLRGLRQELSPEPRLRAGLLDRVGALHAIVLNLRLADGPLSRLSPDAQEFFPWGARLAALLEEMAGQGVRPAAIRNLSGEVSPWAEALLARLDAIGEAYRVVLDEHGWSTPGQDALWLAEHADEAADALEGETLLFAGLHALSGSEDILLRRLWERGLAEFHWHTDPAVALGQAPAWPAREHARWLARWRARAELAGPDTPPPAQTRRFFEGFDLHSQLAVLQRELAALPDTESTAVVLPDAGALVPVMHHLPDVEANISMGYPLRRSALAQLIETILVLHENADATGRYAWRDLIALARHPLLRLLRVEAPDGTAETPLKAAYQAWERHIRAAGAFQDPREWLFAYDAEAVQAPEEAVRALHGEVLAAVFDNFRGLSSLRQAGQALEALCALLRRRGGDLWRRHLLDAECLLRLWQSVVPELTGSILADAPCGQGLIFLILRHLLDAERVSFEPEPLAGLQVLGMLETRLLRFRRLFVLDATEDKLPGASAPDPLLPDPLRQALGLPGRRERDNVASHNFFRLLLGAREVTVFYQAGVRPGALEGKSERSRYVEQLLWELERGQGRLVKPRPDCEGDAPLRLVHFPARPIQPSQPPLRLTPAMRARLAARLAERGVTPSHLELWLACPKKAFFSQVLRLRPLQEVAEDGDRARLGDLVHRVLRDYFAPRLGQPLRADLLDPQALCRTFEEELTREAFSLQMPYDTRVSLMAAGKERLRRYLAGMPDTVVEAIELPVLTSLTLAGMEGQPLSLALQGRIDRVDRRGGGHLVLDYKTGGVAKAGAAAWLETEYFERMAASQPGSPEAEALLAELSESGLDVQLPLYLHLLEASGNGYAPENAAWVELQASGEERPLFAPDVENAARLDVVRSRAPQLVRFVLEHALAAPELAARPGRHCDWCDYQGPCRA